MENNVIEIGGIVVNETDIEKAKKRIVEDVERIVNDPERQEAINAFREKLMARRQIKMFTTALVYAFFAAAFGALGLAGWMLVWLAYPVCTVCGVCSAFNFGRWFENGKCWGWH